MGGEGFVCAAMLRSDNYEHCLHLIATLLLCNPKSIRLFVELNEHRSVE